MGLAAVGCGTTQEGGEDTTTTEPPKPQAIIDIAVDASRDGIVDPADPEDQEFENVWSPEHGAVFLANLDDDDLDQIRDADDQIINGGTDQADLSNIFVIGWSDAPDGATGVLHIDPLSADNVRLWKLGLDGAWWLVGGDVGPCNDVDPTCTVTPDVFLTTEEVRKGLVLGIEARTFRRSLAPEAWSGIVQLGYQINDADGAAITSDDAPNGLDEAKIRVAPWLLFGNASPFTRVLSSNLMPVFTSGITQLTDAAGIEYKKVSDSAYPDQWTQDWLQTGWTSAPRGEGIIQGMKIANARPWGQCGTLNCLPYKWLHKMYLGVDAGIIEIYNKPNSGGTYDSHGNHDLFPPYEFNGESYPFGRIYHGSGVLKETKEFYAAQEVQGPPLTFNTSWLLVGHVDEVIGVVPAAVPRGWKVLLGSMRLARTMLEEQQAKGNGALTMFYGKKWWGPSGQIDAEVSIDEVLADTDLMANSQQSQAEIDDIVELLKNEMGLTDADFIEVPFLMTDSFGGKVAYNPGVANNLVVGDHIAVPKPFGPIVDGQDVFEVELLNRLATPDNELGANGLGLDVIFVDDWLYYHALDGEVHCGTNPDAPPVVTDQWWKVLK